MSTSSQHSKQFTTSTKSVGAGLLAAIVASLCCITPVISLLAGIGGIAATFSWMEPFRPYLIVLTIGVLAFAWYQKLKPSKKLSGQEEIDCACETDEESSFWQSKKFLGIVTLLAALMLAFPTYSHIFYPKNDSIGVIGDNDQTQIKLADFKIKGMTCIGCEEHVKHAVSSLNGVQVVSVSYKDASAQVKYDASIVGLDKITEGINGTGYTVSDSKVSDWHAQSDIFQTIELPVKGMTCSGCESHVTHAVGELAGVKEVKTSYEKGNAIAKYDPDKVEKDKIIETINKTGYKVIENKIKE
ncbi:mercuric transport protein MerTP [Cyclobacterium marinum]|uniref:mercuric transport protein MerTP n=1 Tax=Cyclobacterium marinum TaxID=104 RepID=UPI0011EDBA50|nr:mercuric transport protein MerTP [Cyclobacterium marinum]MBI0398070.1 mercuric transport protein MerTP [Cyclobacterium marinum]MBI0398146.1 mercuric transport protein MerTP [Cyclobacterium marinum]